MDKLHTDPSVPGHGKTKGKPLSQSPSRSQEVHGHLALNRISPLDRAGQSRAGQGTHPSPADPVSRHGTTGTLRCLF